MNQDITASLRQFITTELRPGATLGDDDSLLEGGVLDSMAITRLNEHLETRFGITLGDAEWDDMDNYETISSIARMVQRLHMGAS